eukprot:NODE_174_length_14184_cov_0.583671.p11 type:complete len:124 gc:universal NODE_174_length_14184_cov_0.583671:524-895(+)
MIHYLLDFNNLMTHYPNLKEMRLFIMIENVLQINQRHQVRIMKELLMMDCHLNIMILRITWTNGKFLKNKSRCLCFSLGIYPTDIHRSVHSMTVRDSQISDILRSINKSHPITGSCEIGFLHK